MNYERTALTSGIDRSYLLVLLNRVASLSAELEGLMDPTRRSVTLQKIRNGESIVKPVFDEVPPELCFSDQFDKLEQQRQSLGHEIQKILTSERV